MYKLLILDLDGTIADTSHTIREAANLALRHFGHPEHDAESFAACLGGGSYSFMGKALPPEARTEEHITEVVAEFWRNYDITHIHVDETYPGMDTAVAALHAQGMRIAVLSNKREYMTKPLIEKLLPGMASPVVGRRADIVAKPDPTAALAIAAACGCAPHEVALVGDTDSDMETAHRAGFLAVGVAWGYQPPEHLREAGADVILETPADLFTYFAGK